MRKPRSWLLRRKQMIEDYGYVIAIWYGCGLFGPRWYMVGAALMFLAQQGLLNRIAREEQEREDAC